MPGAEPCGGVRGGNGGSSPSQSFAAFQSSPAPTSTTRGGSSGKAPVHLLAHEVPHRGHLLLGRLEQELVVYLEDEPCGTALVAQPPGDAHHGHLDHVGGRALHDRVHGEPLAQRARLAVRGSQLRDRSAAAEQGANVAVLLGLLDGSGDEVLNVREAREVGVDVGLRLLPRYVELIGEPERGDAVDDPEVDGFRACPARPSSATPGPCRAPRPPSRRGCRRRARTPRAASARPRRGRECAARPASSRRRRACNPALR